MATSRLSLGPLVVLCLAFGALAVDARDSKDEPQVELDRRIHSWALSPAGERSLAGAEEQGAPKSGGLFEFNLMLEPVTLNNLLRTSKIETHLCREYLFPPLLSLDPDDFHLVPELAAQRPVPSDEGRTWTYTLRPGVYWHRGTADGKDVEVTTADVLYSWERMRDPEVDAVAVRNSLSRFVGLEVVDRYTFRVRLEKAYFRAELDFGGDFRLMPAHLAPTDAKEFSASPLGVEPVGYGPYRLERWDRGTSLTLVRDPRYPCADRRPLRIERVRAVFVRDSNVAYDLFLRGELSLASVNDPKRWEEMQADPEYRQKATFHEYYLPKFNFLVWNLEHGALGDVRVRQALAMLCDVRTMADKYYAGHAALTTGPWVPGSPEYDESVEAWPFDPDAAAALLEEAGFTDSDGDGVLDRDGEALRFTLLVEQATLPALDHSIQYFRNTLRRAGIDVTLQPQLMNQIIADVRQHSFEAAVLGWSPEPVQDELSNLFGSDGFDYGHYAHPAMDELLEQYRDAVGESERLAAAARIHRKVRDEQPLTYLPTPKALVLVSTKLRNVSIGARGALIDQWWCEQ